MNWYLGVLKKYAVFGGRARRKEYWFFLLLNFLIGAILTTVDVVAGTGVLGTLYMLGVLIPSIAVTVRRLHDTNHSGWWLFIGLVPLIGLIVVLVFMLQDSQGENEYGPSPKAAEA